MGTYWDEFLEQDSEQRYLQVPVDTAEDWVRNLLKRYHHWLEDKGLVFDPTRGFTMEQLISLEDKSNRMAEVTNNPAWKRTYHRLSDAAVELTGRIQRTGV